MEGLDASAEPWTTYSILAQIAAAKGDSAQAASWRRKANESRDGYAGSRYQIEPILRQFDQVIVRVVAAVNGDENAKTQIVGLFDTFKQGNWQIVDAIQRIWSGERDADALTADIDYNSRAIVLAILDRLAGNAPATAPSTPAPRHSPPAPAQDGMTLDQLVQLVAVARQPGAPPQVAGQLAPLLSALAQDPDMPGEVRALGQALSAVLRGETPDLAGLPPGVADLVRGVL